MPNPETAAPNQYHLVGEGISVSYFPDGFGPLSVGGAPHFMYQDAHHAMSVSGKDVRTADVGDLGTVVSVTLTTTVDVGNTTFSLLLPHVELPVQPNSSAPVQTDGITTVHRAFVGLIGHAQREAYTVTPLTGSAVRGPLPL